METVQGKIPANWGTGQAEIDKGPRKMTQEVEVFIPGGPQGVQAELGNRAGEGSLSGSRISAPTKPPRLTPTLFHACPLGGRQRQGKK